jgi:hypothetical protein
MKKSDLRKAVRNIKPRVYKQEKKNWGPSTIRNDPEKRKQVGCSIIAIAVIFALVGVGAAISNFKEVFGAPEKVHLSERAVKIISQFSLYAF